MNKFLSVFFYFLSMAILLPAIPFVLINFLFDELSKYFDAKDFDKNKSNENN